MLGLLFAIRSGEREASCGLYCSKVLTILTWNTVHRLHTFVLMHEIVTIQIGSQSNFLGTHFWNAQVLRFRHNTHMYTSDIWAGIIFHVRR